VLGGQTSVKVWCAVCPRNVPGLDVSVRGLGHSEVVDTPRVAQAPEVAALARHAPQDDTHIVTYAPGVGTQEPARNQSQGLNSTAACRCHSLHGPSVDTQGQILVCLAGPAIRNSLPMACCSELTLRTLLRCRWCSATAHPRLCTRHGVLVLPPRALASSDASTQLQTVYIYSALAELASRGRHHCHCSAWWMCTGCWGRASSRWTATPTTASRQTRRSSLTSGMHVQRPTGPTAQPLNVAIRYVPCILTVPWAGIGMGRFLAMGTAWANARVYPWENRAYVGGIDNAKILMALRIYGMKHHVYSGAFNLTATHSAVPLAPFPRSIHPSISFHFMQGWRCTTRTPRGRSSSTRCPSRS
jgi:hypothetical protein